MMLEKTDVVRIVEETIREQLSPCVVGVSVRKGSDEDGDALLVIDVVIGTNQAPDKRKMLGLIRHIRQNLENEKDSGFPLLNFLSAKEAKMAGIETV